MSPLNSRLLTPTFTLCSLLLLDKYAVRFIPHENGIHTIDVKFNGSHVVGSPFKVRVGEPGQAGNPALVSAYGAGLEGGTTGEKHCFPHYLSSSRAKLGYTSSAHGGLLCSLFGTMPTWVDFGSHCVCTRIVWSEACIVTPRYCLL